MNRQGHNSNINSRVDQIPLFLSYNQACSPFTCWYMNPYEARDTVIIGCYPANDSHLKSTET